MRDIRYNWNTGPRSVGISKGVQLPQFQVLGHRQRATEINLTTGMRIIPTYLFFQERKKTKHAETCPIWDTKFAYDSDNSGHEQSFSFL